MLSAVFYYQGESMENMIKILELFSRNWLVVLVLVLTIPVFKLAINAYLQVKIAKITNHQKLIISVESNSVKKSLEISSSELNLSDLKEHIAGIESDKAYNIFPYRF